MQAAGPDSQNGQISPPMTKTIGLVWLPYHVNILEEWYGTLDRNGAVPPVFSSDFLVPSRQLLIVWARNLQYLILKDERSRLIWMNQARSTQSTHNVCAQPQGHRERVNERRGRD